MPPTPLLWLPPDSCCVAVICGGRMLPRVTALQMLTWVGHSFLHVCVCGGEVLGLRLENILEPLVEAVV